MGDRLMKKCCTQKENANTEAPEHYPGSHCCPANGKPYVSVKRKTLLHHISQPWTSSLPEQGYYFCTDPDCDVVYFGEDNMVVHTDELKTVIWQKSHDKNAAICYCFGITKALARQDKTIKSFVSKQTKQSNCSCETSNPSGRCCLKDFPES
jgi:hypothetical protein